MKKVLLFLAICALTYFNSASAEKFKHDDPIREDPDRVLSIPSPTSRPLSKTIDLMQKTFLKPNAELTIAQNINTLGEVPESSWFTNRMSGRVMTIEELVRGPNTLSGPDLSGRILIVGAKTEGITPGLRIKDARGDIYFLKFDPLHWPQMATSTEIIGTKFFHAFGYNVPENYLVHWRPEYDLDPDAEVTWPRGLDEKLTEGFVQDVLEVVPVRPDGTIQAVASKFLSGRPIGPFDFQGVRSDDPNDIILHQDRRELRAYKVFCSWLNHNDSDGVNTLDMYYTDENGRSYVKHHLIDFGTIMGSGSHLPHSRRAGNEYYIEFKPSLKAGLTFGIWDRPWRHAKYEMYTSVGRFESDYFTPEKWRPDYPSPAFDRMDLRDALWATRTIMRFSDEAIEAIVKTGGIDDPMAERYVVKHLIVRRDKVVNYYLSQINPLDAFEVKGSGGGGGLSFVNLGLAAGLASDCDYDYEWFDFNNDTLDLKPLTRSSTSEESLPIPAGGKFLMVRITSSCPEKPKWKSAVDVYLRNGPALEVVGVDRQLPGEGS